MGKCVCLCKRYNQKIKLREHIIMNDIEIFKNSIKDLLTPKMLKFSLLPFLISMVVLYILFFVVAGVGLDMLGTLNVESSETTLENGIPHTENFSAMLEGTAIIKFLMSYTITSWVASFFSLYCGYISYTLYLYICSGNCCWIFNAIYTQRASTPSL